MVGPPAASASECQCCSVCEMAGGVAGRIRYSQEHLSFMKWLHNSRGSGYSVVCLTSYYNGN